MSAALRSSAALRVSRALQRPASIVPHIRAFSRTSRRSGGDSHGAESKYDPPTGWLWGIKPGQKVEREGWEMPFYILYCGPLILAGIAMFFKPDTTIQTWALEEARRRLEKEGILEDPFPDHVEPEDEQLGTD